MKKYQYLFLLATMIWTTSSLAALDCKKPYNCSDRGFVSNAQCLGNFVACPLDTSFVKCDLEADNGDFKFSLRSNNHNGWSNIATLADRFKNRFVVGRNTSTNKVKRCMPNMSLIYLTDSYPATTKGNTPKHKHNSKFLYGIGTFDRPDQDFLADSWSAARNTGFFSDTASTTLTTLETTTNEDAGTSNMDPDDCSHVDSYNRPFNMAAFGFLYTTPTNSSATAQADLPESLPTCRELGYTDQKADCPGSYIRCPYDSSNSDTTVVMCDMEAQAGEIKYSITQTADHDGWLLADGRKLSDINSGKYNKSELYGLLKDFSYSLPNYKGMFLKINDGYSKLQKVQPDAIAAHTHKINYTIFDDYETKTLSYKAYYPKNNQDKGEHALPVSDTEGATISTYTSSSWTGSMTGVTSNLTTSNYSDTTHEVRPENFGAYIFIYSGKLNRLYQ